MGDRTEEPQPQVVTALQRILATEPELFCDSVGQARIRLPASPRVPDKDAPDLLDKDAWGLRSHRVRAWIADFAWEAAKHVLQDREIDRIINILEGKAWQDRRRNLELEEAIEHDPVLEALLLLMENERTFSDTMTVLLKQLKNVATQAGLDVKSKNWPRGAPQLSIRMGNLERFLAAANITTKRERSGYRRTITLEQKRNDGASSPSSQGPSVDKSHHPKNERPSDASDPKIRAAAFARVEFTERKTP